MPGQKFTYDDVVEFRMFGVRQSWEDNNDVLVVVLEKMAVLHASDFNNLVSTLFTRIPWVSKDRMRFTRTKRINGTDWWCDTNLATKRAVERARKAFGHFGHSDKELVIVTRARQK